MGCGDAMEVRNIPCQEERKAWKKREREREASDERASERGREDEERARAGDRQTRHRRWAAYRAAYESFYHIPRR